MKLRAVQGWQRGRECPLPSPCHLMCVCLRVLEVRFLKSVLYVWSLGIYFLRKAVYKSIYLFYEMGREMALSPPSSSFA